MRGPLDVLREDWTGDKETAVPVATHIIEMREQLAEMTGLVAKHAAAGQEKQKQQYDKNARSQKFSGWRSGTSITSHWSQQTQAPMDRTI